MFKQGDYVKCIDAVNHLKNGDVYQVQYVIDNRGLIAIRGVGGRQNNLFFAKRFVKYNKPVEELVLDMLIRK